MYELICYDVCLWLLWKKTYVNQFGFLKKEHWFWLSHNRLSFRCALYQIYSAHYTRYTLIYKYRLACWTWYICIVNAALISINAYWTQTTYTIIGVVLLPWWCTYTYHNYHVWWQSVQDGFRFSFNSFWYCHGTVSVCWLKFLFDKYFS